LQGRELPRRLSDYDLDAVNDARAAVRDAVRAGALASAHDVADGGLAVALAECCLAGGVGATVTVDVPELATAEDERGLGPGSEAVLTALFGEGPGGWVVSGELAALRALGEHVAVRHLGEVGGERLQVTIGTEQLSWDSAQMTAANEALGPLF